MGGRGGIISYREERDISLFKTDRIVHLLEATKVLKYVLVPLRMFNLKMSIERFPIECRKTKTSGQSQQM